MDFNKLEKSIWKILSSYPLYKSEISKFDSLIHIPAKRLDPTFLIYMLFKPKNFYLLISKEVKENFENSYNKFIEFYHSEIKENIPFAIKEDFFNFPLPYDKLNLIFLEENNFDNFENFKSFFRQIIEKIVKQFSVNNILIDITGGKKMHSVICAEIASIFHITYSYLDVIEKSNIDGISAVSGSESLYIKNPESKRLNYLSIYSYPILSLSNNSISCFYNGASFSDSFEFEKENFIKIISIFSKYSENLKDFLSNNLAMMIEDDYLRIKNELRSYFSSDFIEKLENIIKTTKRIIICLNKELWNFPFEFIFNDYNDILILRSIPEVLNFSIFHDDEAKDKNSGSRILLAALSADEKIKIQFELLKDFFSKIPGIDFVPLYLPEKDKFLNEFSKCNIAHIITHGDIKEDTQIFYIENKKENDCKYLYPKDFEDIKSADFVFISACSSLTLNVDWDKTIYYQFMKNGCKTIIGTHWAVLQEEASKISVNFYKNFIDGQPINMALHNSLIDLNNNFLNRNYYIIGNHAAILK